MPRLYLSVSELNDMPLGIALSPQLAQLPPGALDRILIRASARCDSYARKRLQAPGATTLSSTASAGATTLVVASTLTLDNRDEQAVLIGSGSSQELRALVSGGVSVSSYVAPYPGTLTLAQPLINTHSPGESIQYLYQEVTEAGHGGNSDRFGQAITQEAQLAQAHGSAQMHYGDLTRIIFLKNYPILAITSLEYTYPFDTQYYSFSSMSALVIEPGAGYVRFRAGTAIVPEGFVRTTYTGGYQVIPDDVKEAAMRYIADELTVFVNPHGATQNQQGKRNMRFSGNKSLHVQAAEDILARYRRHI